LRGTTKLTLSLSLSLFAQVMSYLIHASKFRSEEPTSSKNLMAGSNVDEIAESLTRSNVILEAFGNAKTVRNDNSSRFGKYIKLLYDNNKYLIGAYTEKFLLEKTRLMQADKGERTYHVFYQMLKGLPEDTKAKLSLTEARDFAMLSNGNTWEVPNVDDAEEFEALHTALETVDIVGEE
jgi:myosin-5